jgi:hypothetical protein
MHSRPPSWSFHVSGISHEVLGKFFLSTVLELKSSLMSTRPFTSLCAAAVPPVQAMRRSVAQNVAENVQVLMGMMGSRWIVVR